ncbi:hypothetical protein PR001_g8699 [Phytophthora rubi]|uniref:Uncharacterized protein n=2 Tax=Phytophthora rubi TaxID=129364 RepID=A0A6A3MWB2_9STRA|nr:hypothetical protein PR002_g8665 [Phytophthora rubi]KAE9036711.1 hypothetical protein PR001_g8699 [Phytophthora rubi]
MQAVHGWLATIDLRLLVANMEVLKTTAISEKKAAKLLKKFVASKEEEENADLVINEEVKVQLTQVLAHLEGKKPQIQLQQDEYQFGQY